MHDDTDYVRAGLAIIILVGVCLTKVILFLKPAVNINYEKLSILEDNYHWEMHLDEEATTHREATQKDY